MQRIAEFPEISGRALTGRAMTLPQDFAARRNLVIVAFKQWQQAQVDAWIEWAQEDIGVPPALPGTEPGAPVWLGSRVESAVYELPILPRRWSLTRSFIDGGMAAAIRDPVVLARTVTIYTDVDGFARDAGLSSTEDVSALVVDESGAIIARVTGPCRQELQRVIRVAMRESAAE